jgi:hypothetical protein
VKRSAVYVLAAALLFGATGGIAAAVPAGAAVTHDSQLPKNFPLVNFPTISFKPVPRCLGINSAGNAGIWNCTYKNDQSWHLGKQLGTTGYYQLVNGYDQCLGVPGQSTDPNVRLVGTNCNKTHEDQYWADLPATPDGDVYVWWFNYHSLLAIGVEAGKTNNGAPVVQYGWQQKRNNQLWVTAQPG